MGRHFYLLESTYDYDGREEQIHYLGVNRKAAEHRMSWLYDFVRAELFGDQDDDCLELYEPTIGTMDLDNRNHVVLGSAAIYDDGRGAYYNLRLHAIKTNIFFNPLEERQYRAEFPTKRF